MVVDGAIRLEHALLPAAYPRTRNDDALAKLDSDLAISVDDFQEV